MLSLLSFFFFFFFSPDSSAAASSAAGSSSRARFFSLLSFFSFFSLLCRSSAAAATTATTALGEADGDDACCTSRSASIVADCEPVDPASQPVVSPTLPVRLLLLEDATWGLAADGLAETTCSVPTSPLSLSLCSGPSPPLSRLARCARHTVAGSVHHLRLLDLVVVAVISRGCAVLSQKKLELTAKGGARVGRALFRHHSPRLHCKEEKNVHGQDEALLFQAQSTDVFCRCPCGIACPAAPRSLPTRPAPWAACASYRNT